MSRTVLARLLWTWPERRDTVTLWTLSVLTSLSLEVSYTLASLYDLQYAPLHQWVACVRMGIVGPSCGGNPLITWDHSRCCYSRPSVSQNLRPMGCQLKKGWDSLLCICRVTCPLRNGWSVCRERWAKLWGKPLDHLGSMLLCFYSLSC